MAMRKLNKKRKNSNMLPDSHFCDKNYFSFWSKTGPFDDPMIAELFAMIEEAKRNTVVPEIPTKRMKKETVEEDQGLRVPMNDNEIAKNNGEGDDDGYCERKTETLLGDQNLVMPEIPTKRMKIETVQDDQSSYVSMNDNEIAKNGDDNGDGDYCYRKTEQIIDISDLPVPKGQKSIDVVRTSDEKDQEDSIVNLKSTDVVRTSDEKDQEDSIVNLKSTDVVRTSDEKDQEDSIVNLKPDKKRHFSTDILKYFSVVSELDRGVCQRSLDNLSMYKTTNNLKKFFTVIEKEENTESKSQKSGILFKREGH